MSFDVDEFKNKKSEYSLGDMIEEGGGGQTDSEPIRVRINSRIMDCIAYTMNNYNLNKNQSVKYITKCGALRTDSDGVLKPLVDLVRVLDDFENVNEEYRNMILDQAIDDIKHVHLYESTGNLWAWNSGRFELGMYPFIESKGIVGKFQRTMIPKSALYRGVIVAGVGTVWGKAEELYKDFNNEINIITGKMIRHNTGICVVFKYLDDNIKTDLVKRIKRKPKLDSQVSKIFLEALGGE